MAKELQSAAPADAGVPAGAVLELINALEENDCGMEGLMIARHGKVIAQGWWQPYGRETPRQLYSLSKSFTCAAVGFAVAQGLLKVSDTVASFFPKEAEGCGEDMLRITVHNLLTMASGHDPDPTPGVFSQKNWVEAFFNTPLSCRPGSKFVYNTAATYMCSAIVQKLTGQRVFDYLTPLLFEPLGIDATKIYWNDCPMGICQGGTGLHARTEDILRFGLCLLNGGKYGGRQVLPKEWVGLATSKQIENAHHSQDPNWTAGYGYQFWRCASPGVYRGDGMYGQYCLVCPRQDMVVAIQACMANLGKPLQLIMGGFFDALDTARPGEQADEAALEAKLGALKMPLPAHTAPPQNAAQLSGRYSAEHGALGIKVIDVRLEDDGAGISLGDGKTAFCLRATHGVWTDFDQDGGWFFGRREGRATGGWVSPQRLEVQVVYPRSPETIRFAITFKDDCCEFAASGAPLYAHMVKRAVYTKQ